MAAKPKRARSERRRRPGKRVENLTSDREARSALAIQAAINFIAQSIMRERMATAAGSASAETTEASLRSTLESISTVDVCRARRDEDPDRFATDIAAVDEVVSRMSSAMIRALPKQFEQALKKERFRGLHTILAGPQGPEPTRFFNVAAADDEILQRMNELKRLEEQVRAAEQNPDEQARLMAKGDELMKAFDELTSSPATETELRTALGRQLGESERNVRRLEESTGLRFLRKTTGK